MSQEPGAKQHIIPAAHIGSFSINEEIGSKRKRPIWFRRDGMQQTKELIAEAVGVRKHIYTLNEYTEPRYVDKTWDYVEHHLSEAVTALKEHSRGPLFDGSLWATVLVPFVAQLFCRGEEYGGLLHERAPHLETLNQAIGNNGVDNINMNRLIDFQINCGLLCNAEWRLLHNQTTIPFILSDLGYAPIQAERYGYGTGRGYFIPMSKTLALVITQRLPLREPSHSPYGKKIMLLNSPLTDRNKVKFFNERIAKCAFSEAYGSTMEVLNQAWGERIIRRKEAPLGPALIQSPLADAIKIEIHWKWMDLFGIPTSTRKELYGGRKIQVVNGDFEKHSTVAIVYNEKAKTQIPYGLAYKEL